MDLFLLLRSEDISFYTALTSCSHPQRRDPRRGLPNVHTEGLAVFHFLLWLSRPKWGRAFTHQDIALFQILYEYVVFSKWELHCYRYILSYFIHSYQGTRRKMPRPNTGRNTSPSFLLLRSAGVRRAPESRYFSEH